VIDTVGAVNKPDGLIVPAVADHVTALFGLLLTVALYCCLAPGTRFTFGGEVETLTFWLVVVEGEDDIVPPPHPVTERAIKAISDNIGSFLFMFKPLLCKQPLTYPAVRGVLTPPSHSVSGAARGKKALTWLFFASQRDQRKGGRYVCHT
jgi:hypothetical protein